jgi:hypothetical protein
MRVRNLNPFTPRLPGVYEFAPPAPAEASSRREGDRYSSAPYDLPVAILEMITPSCFPAVALAELGCLDRVTHCSMPGAAAVGWRRPITVRNRPRVIGYGRPAVRSYCDKGRPELKD